jgi:hypothetical protein
MDARWAAAQASIPAFYPTTPSLGPVLIDGVNVYYASIYNNAPYMGFTISSTGSTQGLLVYGEIAIGSPSMYIKYNIAVIRESDGKGWVTGSGAGDLLNQPDAYKMTVVDYYSPEHRWFSASELTTGEITSMANLSGYNIYVIVRNTSNLAEVVSDLNNSPFGYEDLNVIRVLP